jgi:uncharacterized protein (TIGR00725 family)
MNRRVQIAVCGPGEADPDLEVLAEAVGRGLAARGAVLVCGGGGGVMAAAARGARDRGGEVIGILPETRLDAADEHCSTVIATGAGQARNLAVALSGDALVAIGGGWGTLSEIALARRFERPVVALGSWELRSPAGSAPGGIVAAEDPGRAVAAALAAARERYPSAPRAR